MPKNRNNKVSKSFAIGTKIEYNGKLYEVIKSNQCCDCSLRSICSSNDKSSNNKGDLLREARIKIFGECSSITRDDNISVVFVEVPTSKEPKVYNTVLYEIDYNHKYITIDIPEGFIIDKDNSDLDKGIIKFKSKWLTLKELYEIFNKNDYITYRSLIKDFKNASLLALATFMDIISYFNGDWKFNAEKDNHGYAIAFYYNTTEYPQYHVITIDSTSDIYYGNPIFKNEADAQYVIDNPNFREVLDNIFKV